MAWAIKKYEDLEEGEYVAFFGTHVLRWADVAHDDPTIAVIKIDDEKLASLEAENARLREALKDALQTAEFESHPFRAWHNKAREALKGSE